MISRTTLADQLTRALLSLTSRGQRPRCGDPADAGLWLSDYAEERALACTLCHGCPVIQACGEAAEAAGERFGVWAGQDRTAPKPGPTSDKPKGDGGMKRRPVFSRSTTPRPRSRGCLYRPEKEEMIKE
jgi:hypothetical protein